MRIRARDGTFVDIDVSLVEGVLPRMRGLIGRPEPPQSAGVMLRGKQVHTFGIKYPIDVVHVARDGTVLGVVNLQRRRLSPIHMKAHWILELRSGEAERLGIRRGSVVITEEGG